MKLKPIPIDSGDFVRIRTAEGPMVYADKTAHFHRLITDKQARNFFLARQWHLAQGTRHKAQGARHVRLTRLAIVSHGTELSLCDEV